MTDVGYAVPWPIGQGDTGRARPAGQARSKGVGGKRLPTPRLAPRPAAQALRAERPAPIVLDGACDRELSRGERGPKDPCSRHRPTHPSAAATRRADRPNAGIPVRCAADDWVACSSRWHRLAGPK